MTVADADKNGTLSVGELEALLRGWAADKYDKAANATEIGEKNRLAGAAERAEAKRVEGGGFAGLDEAEALRVGQEAKLGGEVVENPFDGMVKALQRMPTALAERLGLAPAAAPAPAPADLTA